VLHDARQQIGTDPTHTATASGHSPNNRTSTCRSCRFQGFDF
jgi:hypothetical protein